MRNVERAKKIAADKGVNISFVCREIGKSRGYISQMLTTDRDFPDEMLSPVANALGVTVEELTGSQKKTRPSSRKAKLTRISNGLSRSWWRCQKKSAKP